MAKKKYNPDDPDTWTDAQMNKYIVDKVQEIGVNLPWEKVVLSGIFTYGWWKAYGQGPIPTKGDIMLGITYALTIPPALSGGLAANTWALAMMQTMVVGMIIPPGATDELRSNLLDNLQDLSERPQNFIDNITAGYTTIQDWWDSLPTLTPP